jgi:hypothetical protein
MRIYNSVIKSICLSLDQAARAKSSKKVFDSNNQEWETIKGSFIYVALLANSMVLDDMGSGGMSKYAHLADGSLDLILIDKLSRKDLYRFIKRHANSKNQVRYFSYRKKYIKHCFTFKFELL